ncbi:hypothetical protein Taro_014574 [Colocasia esculenta]|uniref:Uncharacterized protein n=1 Tax=Colocasia esculenta TaxID=4460 RepID=A0A843UIJ1_COLES|nr:hypothetical protein [Colocasia esculenta]
MSKGEKIARTWTTFSCKGSVDTTISGVDTMAQSKDRNVKKRSTSVDTSPGQVDTRDLSQGIDLPVWDSVSTHLMGRSVSQVGGWRVGDPNPNRPLAHHS